MWFDIRSIMMILYHKVFGSLGYCTYMRCWSFDTFHTSGGTVDNNLGPDRSNRSQPYCRQPMLSLCYLCMDVVTLHGNELRLILAKALSSTNTINVTHPTLGSSSYNFWRLLLWRGLGRESKPSPPKRKVDTLRVTLRLWFMIMLWICRIDSTSSWHQAVVVTTFDVFSYAGVWAENRTHHIIND